MSGKTDDADHDDAHEKAREMAEDALEAYAEGDKARADRLAAEAAKLDRSAVEELVEEIDEDAGSNHDVPKA